jgi:hypothetical protein
VEAWVELMLEVVVSVVVVLVVVWAKIVVATAKEVELVFYQFQN